MMPRIITIALAGAALVLGPAAFWCECCRPGTVNYIEGAACLNGQQLTGKKCRQHGPQSRRRAEHANRQSGNSPHARCVSALDDNSEVKMISPDLTKTQVELDHGRAESRSTKSIPKTTSTFSTQA